MGKPISITDAHTLLQDTKILEAGTVCQGGSEVVGTYVNMPVDTVRAIGGGATHDILCNGL